jgi:catalase (peroxidase I)
LVLFQPKAECAAINPEELARELKNLAKVQGGFNDLLSVDKKTLSDVIVLDGSAHRLRKNRYHSSIEKSRCAIFPF